MKKDLLDLLECPCCHEHSFSLREHTVNEAEISEGDLVCNMCNRAFPVRNGILDMRVGAVESGWEEVQESHVSMVDDHWLLGCEQRYRNACRSDAGGFSFGAMLNFDKAVDEMHLSGGEVILDLGAGTTWTSNALAKKGARCVALDITARKYIGLESADTFMAHSGTHYERILADMNDLPFRASVFDIVMSNSVAHHSANMERTFREVYSVLKPGGSLFLANEPMSSIGGLLDGRLSEEDKKQGEHTYCFLQYLWALKRAGFRQRIYYPPGLSHRLDALADSGKLQKPTTLGQSIKYRVVAMLLPCWRRSRLVRLAVEKCLFWPYLVIVGQFAIVKATRPHLYRSRTAAAS